MIGADSGAYHYFTTADGLDEKDFPWQHDLCHDLELKLNKWRLEINAKHNDIFATCHKWLKFCYARYSRSPNKMRNLAELAKEMDTTFKKLVALYEVRFLVSEMKSTGCFLHDLPCIAQDLENAKTAIGSTVGSTEAAMKNLKQKRELTSFKKQVLNRKMVMFLLVLFDIHSVNIKFSALAQSQSLLVCDLVDMKKNYKIELTKMTVTFLDGGKCASSLKDLQNGEFKNKDGLAVKLSGMSLLPVDNCSSSSSSSNSDSNGDGDGERKVDPEATKNQLMKLQKDLVSILLGLKKTPIGGADAKEFCVLPKCAVPLNKVLNLDEMAFLSNENVAIPDDFAGK